MLDPTTMKPGDLLEYPGEYPAWPFSDEGRKAPLSVCWHNRRDRDLFFSPQFYLPEKGVAVFLEHFSYETVHWFKVLHPDHGVILLSYDVSKLGNILPLRALDV